MKLSIIILTYNSSQFIHTLLSDLTRKYADRIKERDLEVIVADNLSTDDTVKTAKQNKNIQVLENGENLGFSKGLNKAVKKAQGDVLLFINPDAKLLSGNFFDFISKFEDPKLGVLGGEIRTYQGKKEPSCGKIYNLLNVFLLSVGLEEALGVRFSPSKDKEVDMVSGAFFAIKRELFEKLNGFDEHFFMYIEDAELCYRVKKEGYKVEFSNKASIKHLGQGSSNRTFAIVNIYKGLLYFHKKHMGGLSYLSVLFVLRFKAGILVLLGKISHNEYLEYTYAQALKSIS